MLEFNGQIPSWLFWLVKLLGISIGNPWDEKWARDISNLIEDGLFTKAKEEIALMEGHFGVSTETIRLGTRIDRIRILGR